MASSKEIETSHANRRIAFEWTLVSETTDQCNAPEVTTIYVFRKGKIIIIINDSRYFEYCWRGSSRTWWLRISWNVASWANLLGTPKTVRCWWPTPTGRRPRSSRSTARPSTQSPGPDSRGSRSRTTRGTVSRPCHRTTNTVSSWSGLPCTDLRSRSPATTGNARRPPTSHRIYNGRANNIVCCYNKYFQCLEGITDLTSLSGTYPERMCYEMHWNFVNLLEEHERCVFSFFFFLDTSIFIRF